MAQRVIAAATAAGATTIGLPHATATFTAAVANASKLSYHLNEDSLTWIQDRSSFTILEDPNNKGLPTMNGLMKQTRAFCVKSLDDTFFELQAVTVAGKETAKYLRVKNHLRQRVLFIEADLATVKKYYGDPNVEFVVPKVNPNTVDAIQKFIVKYKRARGDTNVALKKETLPDRVYASYEEIFKAGKKYHTLIGVDVGYSMTKQQVDYLMVKLGAVRMLHVMFLPPELAFPHIPKNQFYGLEMVADEPFTTQDELSGIMMKYYELTKHLRRQLKITRRMEGEKMELCNYQLNVVKGVHVIRPVDDMVDDPYVLEQVALFHGEGQADGIVPTVRLVLKELDATWAKLHAKKQEPSYMDLSNAAWVILDKIINGDDLETVHVWFEGQGQGSLSRGYLNRWSTWQSYIEPAWEVRSVDDQSGDYVNNYTLTNLMQSGYHVLQSIVRHTHGGPIVATWRLHPMDEYCRVMNVEETLNRFGSGMKSTFVYESFPSRITGELMMYLSSLSQDSLFNKDAPANALLWLRKRLVHVTIGGQADGRSTPLIPVDKMRILAYGAYFQVLDEKSLLREVRGEIGVSPTWVSHIRTWFFSLVDQTVLGDFMEWLTRRRWFKKFVLMMPSVKHMRMYLSEQRDVENRPGNYLDKTKIKYGVDDDIMGWCEMDAPNLPPVKFPEEKHAVEIDPIQIKAEPKADCMICEAAKSCGIDLDTMKCSHNDPTVNFSIGADEWRTFLLQCGKGDVTTPEQITSLELAVKEAFKGLDKIEGKTRLYNITGLPGTGKSYLLRALGVYLREKEGITTIGLYSPFAKLYNEYKWEALDHHGKPLDRLFSFKTTHRAMLEFVGLKYIFVEEFGAVNFNMFAPLIERNPGVTFVTCGDVNQTQLQAHEGKNVYAAIDQTNINNHTLTLNRRNPPEHVAWANNFLPPGLQMKAFKTKSSPIQVFYDQDVLDAAHPNWRTAYDVMSFSKRTFTAMMGDQTPDGNPMKPVTVRSCQGSTFTNGVLLVGSGDIQLLKNSAMSLVALTRCTDMLAIYVMSNKVEIHSWLARCQQVLDHENLNLPISSASAVAHEPEEPKLVKPKMLSSGVEEGLISGTFDETIPVDGDHDEIETAHGVRAEALASIATYKVDCDGGVALTHALNPVRHEPEKLQIADMPRNIPNYAVQAKVESSALRRANAKMPVKELSPADNAHWDRIIEMYFDRFKHKITISEDVITDIWLSILKDAQSRHYWERLMSQNAENPDPNMIGLVDVMERCMKPEFMQECIQRMSIKEAMKMNNSAKVDSIFSAAQTIASQPVPQWFQFTFLERLTAYIDKQTNNTEYKVGKGVLLSRHGESDEDYMKRADVNMSRIFGQRLADMVYTDGNKTDSGGSDGSVEVLKKYRKKLITFVDVSKPMQDWFMNLTDLMYKCTRNNPVLAAHVRFQAKMQTPSGYVATFSDAMTYCNLATFASVEIVGECLMQEGGDDGAVAGDHISESVEGAALVDRTSNIEIRVVKAIGSERVLDFTGMLIYSGCYENKVYNCIVPNIVRKHDKVLGNMYKDAKHIGEAMVSVRQLTKKLGEVEDFDENTVYVNAAHYKQMNGCDMSTALDVVYGYITELNSLTCTKAKDIANKSKKRVKPADPRSVEVGAAGSGVYMSV